MNEKRAPSSSAGFTLVELMAVVLVIGILMMLAIPYGGASVKRAQAVACMATRVACEKALVAYRLAHNDEIGSLEQLVKGNFIASMPACPSGGTYVWSTTKSGPEDYPVLMCSVHSGVEDTGPKTLYTNSGSSTEGLTNVSGSWTGSKKGWKPLSKNWGNLGTFGDTKWTDYTYSATGEFNKGSGWGMFYRSTGGSAGNSKDLNGYCFQVDPGLGNKFVVRTWKNGSESSPIATASFPPGFDPKKPHKVSVTVIGNVHTVSVNGKTVLQFKDSTYKSGRAGVRNWGSTPVTISDISITSAR